MRARAATRWALAGALLLAGPAHASKVDILDIPPEEGGPLKVLVIQDSAGENNVPSFEYEGNDGFVYVRDAGGIEPGASATCESNMGGARVKCPMAGLQALLFFGGDGGDQLTAPDWPLPISFYGANGNDALNMAAVVEVYFGGGEGSDDAVMGQSAGGAGTQSIEIDLGGGNDTALATGGGDVVVKGGAGNDEITTGDRPISDSFFPVATTLDGGEGDDTLSLGDGRDTASGGPGTDLVRYSLSRRGPGGVSVTLDATADDGRPGEGDNVVGTGPDAVENVAIGMGVGDTSKVVGSDGPNALSGDNVDLEGRGGDDTLSGGDTTRQERIDGGPGNDTLVGGFGPDLLIGGEGVDSFSGDRAATDVISATGDDRIEARDGNAESIGCGIGADVAVVDHNDVTAPDCESVDRAPPPPGPAAPATPKTVSGKLSAAFRRVRGAWLVRRLEVRAVTAGAAVEIRCRGRRCPFARRKFTVRSGRAKATTAFRRRRLRPGVVIEVRITAPGATGRVFTLTLRRKGTPRRTTRCLPPGATRPIAC